MANKKQQKVVDALIKGGSDTWSAIHMVTLHYDEAIKLYPNVSAPSQIAKLIRIAAS